MRGKYYTMKIGEALQKIPVLRHKNQVFATLKSNWAFVCPNFDLVSFSEKTGILRVKTSMPAIYTRHAGPDIAAKCNNFLGNEAIKEVKICQ